MLCLDNFNRRAFGCIFRSFGVHSVWFGSRGCDICVILRPWPWTAFHFFNFKAEMRFDVIRVRWIQSCTSSSHWELENFPQDTISPAASRDFSLPPLSHDTDDTGGACPPTRRHQGALHGGKETKRCTQICTAFEGTWRHLESLFFPTPFFWGGWGA